MKGQGETFKMIMGLGLAVVIGVVVLVVVNGIITDVANPTWSNTTAINYTTTTEFTPCGLGIVAGSEVCRNHTTGTLLTSADYNLTDSNCTMSPNKASGTGLMHLANCTYVYSEVGTYTSATSRTIASYLVPLALLGILALAAGFVYLRFFK